MKTFGGFGFAAGCEAVAVPCRKEAFHILGYALGAAFGPINPKGLSPDQGRSPGNNLAVFGGAQPPPHIRRQSRT